MLEIDRTKGFLESLKDLRRYAQDLTQVTIWKQAHDGVNELRYFGSRIFVGDKSGLYESWIFVSASQPIVPAGLDCEMGWTLFRKAMVTILEWLQALIESEERKNAS